MPTTTGPPDTVPEMTGTVTFCPCSYLRFLAMSASLHGELDGGVGEAALTEGLAELVLVLLARGLGGRGGEGAEPSGGADTGGREDLGGLGLGLVEAGLGAVAERLLVQLAGLGQRQVL